jgi:hypothetical protein
VASSHFDSGMPIRLDVGAPIVEILGITCRPDSLHTPTAAVNDTAVTLAPGLIAKGQTIHFSILVDGPSPRLTCQASLIDVTVQERRDPVQQSHVASRVLTFVMLGGGLVVLLLSGLLSWWFTQGQRVHLSYLYFLNFSTLLSILAILAFVSWRAKTTWSSRRRASRPPNQT